MMQTAEPVQTIPMRDRLSVKLALLFAIAFFGSLVVMGGWSLLGMLGERDRAATEVNVQAPAIVIDPKIQQDLAKALAFDAIPAVTQVQNPFVDRAGLSGTVGIGSTTSSGKPNASSTGSSGGSPQKPGSGGTSASSTTIIGPQGAELVYISPPDATKSRYEDWLARQQRGESVVPVSEVLGVEDLVPVGFASGGSREAEVILLSLSLCRTFTFPAGTRLYDGLLNGFDQREVVFVFGNGVRRKSYLSEDVCRPTSPTGVAGTTN